MALFHKPLGTNLEVVCGDTVEEQVVMTDDSCEPNTDAARPDVFTIGNVRPCQFCRDQHPLVAQWVPENQAEWSIVLWFRKTMNECPGWTDIPCLSPDAGLLSYDHCGPIYSGSGICASFVRTHHGS